MNTKNTISIQRNGPLFLKGAAMGIAEVIPGVSGGTIALVTGIYERLITAIKGVDLVLLQLLFRGQLKSCWKKIDGSFLFLLVCGMVGGIVVGVFGVHYLMENYPEPLYAFFFGLILASAWYVGRQVGSWGFSKVVALIAGVVIAFMVTQISPAEGSVTPVYLALSGFIAVSALMLPGVSGSFMLLLLGMYTVVIGALKEVLSGTISQIWILLSFAVGMLGGLVVFSRVMTWMFERYHQVTLALLSGFMIGSLPKIWPWRIPVQWIDEQGNIIESGVPGEEARILTEAMVMPESYSGGEPHVIVSILSFLAGLLVIVIAAAVEHRLRLKKIQ